MIFVVYGLLPFFTLFYQQMGQKWGKEFIMKARNNAGLKVLPAPTSPYRIT